MTLTQRLIKNSLWWFPNLFITLASCNHWLEGITGRKKCSQYQLNAHCEWMSWFASLPQKWNSIVISLVCFLHSNGRRRHHNNHWDCMQLHVLTMSKTQIVIVFGKNKSKMQISYISLLFVEKWIWKCMFIFLFSTLMQSQFHRFFYSTSKNEIKCKTMGQISCLFALLFWIYFVLF